MKCFCDIHKGEVTTTLPCPACGTAMHVSSDGTARECNECSLKNYRDWRNRTPYSAEELAEMRAAFGPGVTLVNVITGQRIVT